jgi:hypothetical protein
MKQLADDKDAAKFYCTFKVHKKHEPMTAPPPRPTVSGPGSATENIAAFSTTISKISPNNTSHISGILIIS